VVVSGLGKVGSALATLLAGEGTSLSVADIVGHRVDMAVDQLQASPVPPEKAHAVDCDIFSPCALGGALDSSTIAELRAAAVVGAANNQLAHGEADDELERAGVLYAPDYAVNAGGLINIADELSPGGWSSRRASAAVARIYETTERVLDVAAASEITTAGAADLLAEERISRVGDVARIRRAQGGRTPWPT